MISMEKGGDINGVYRRLQKGMCEMGKYLKYSKHPRLGYLSMCPTNLGTSMRASAHVKLPKLGADEQNLKKLASRLGLSVRGTGGELTTPEANTYDISNKARLGITEIQTIKLVSCGIKELISMEQKLQR